MPSSLINRGYNKESFKCRIFLDNDNAKVRRNVYRYVMCFFSELYVAMIHWHFKNTLYAYIWLSYNREGNHVVHDISRYHQANLLAGILRCFCIIATYCPTPYARQRCRGFDDVIITGCVITFGYLTCRNVRWTIITLFKVQRFEVSIHRRNRTEWWPGINSRNNTINGRKRFNICHRKRATITR